MYVYREICKPKKKSKQTLIVNLSIRFFLWTGHKYLFRSGHSILRCQKNYAIIHIVENDCLIAFNYSHINFFFGFASFSPNCQRAWKIKTKTEIYIYIIHIFKKFCNKYRLSSMICLIWRRRQNTNFYINQIVSFKQKYICVFILKRTC